MLWNRDLPIVKIISVNRMKWSGNVFNVAPRKHSAIAFRIKGSAIIRASGKEYRVNPNDVLYIPQNIGYTAEYTDTEIIVVHFITLTSGEAPEVYSFDNCEAIYKAFNEMLSLWENKRTGFELFVTSQLYGIIGILQNTEAKTKLPDHFLKAVAYINANYRDPSLTIPEVCKQAGISETVFRSLFKEYYKKPPVAYVNGMRLEYAADLIANGSTVEAAATESGFGDSKYFARIVKKTYGCTPRSFKNWGK